MSVPDQPTIFPHTGNGVTTTFAYGCYLLAAEDLVVSIDGAELTSGFTIVGVGSPSGGAVIFDVAPAIDTSIQLYRQVTLERETDYQRNGDLRSDTLNRDFDRIWMAIQDARRDVSRALRYPIFENLDGQLQPAGARKNMVHAYDANGYHQMVPMPSSLGTGDNVYDTFIAGVHFNPGVATQLTLSRQPGTPGNVIVAFDDSLQGPDQWSIAGNVLTFSSPIPAGIGKVFVRIGTSFSTTNPPVRSVGDHELTWGSVLGRVVESVADLKGLPSATYRRAFVLGYYAPGDGGGGSYWLDSTDTATPDDGGSVLIADDGGRWKLAQTGWIDVRQFGAKGDAVADDTSALGKVRAFVGAQAHNWQVIFSAGVYCYTVSPNWAITGLRVIARGNVVLRYKGTGDAVIIDGGGSAGLDVEDCIFGMPGNPFVIEAPKSAKNAIFARALLTGCVVSAVVRGAGSNSAGLLTNWCVLTIFHVQVVPYRSGWYDDGTGAAKPQVGFNLNQRSAGEQTSYCTFVSPVANACQFGLYLDNTLGNIFICGDAEFNTNTGAVLTGNARNNKFFGTNFEVNGTAGVGADVTCAGFYNEFICDTGSNGVNGGFRIVGGEGNKLKGGVHDYVIVDTGAIGSYVGEITYQRSLSGNLSITDNGTRTGFGKNWAAQQQRYTFGPRVVNPLTLGGSPFTYTNNSGMRRKLFVSGGTISAMQYYVNGSPVATLATNSEIIVEPTDQVTITYSVVPSVNEVSV